MTLSLWAVPVNATSLKDKYKAKNFPRVVLNKNVKTFNDHEIYPQKMDFEVRHRDMMVRQVGLTYEYGWVLRHDNAPFFMVCHETTKQDENVLNHGLLLDQSTVEADVLYSLGGVLIEPKDIAHIMNDLYNS